VTALRRSVPDRTRFRSFSSNWPCFGARIRRRYHLIVTLLLERVCEM
jgi:hypothetical protein